MFRHYKLSILILAIIFLFCRKKSSEEYCPSSSARTDKTPAKFEFYNHDLPLAKPVDEFPSAEDPEIIKGGDTDEILLGNARRFYGKAAENFISGSFYSKEKPDISARLNAYGEKVSLIQRTGKIGIIQRPGNALDVSLEGYFMQNLWILQGQRWVPMPDSTNPCQKIQIVYLNADDIPDILSVTDDSLMSILKVYISDRERNLLAKQTIHARGVISIDAGKKCHAEILAQNQAKPDDKMKIRFDCRSNRFNF
jgi:hypothetical protein